MDGASEACGFLEGVEAAFCELSSTSAISSVISSNPVEYSVSSGDKVGVGDVLLVELEAY